MQHTQQSLKKLSFDQIEHLLSEKQYQAITKLQGLVFMTAARHSLAKDMVINADVTADLIEKVILRGGEAA